MIHKAASLTVPGRSMIQFLKTLNSAIHKAACLTVPGHSMILPGTIPETPISHEWSQWLERPLGVVPTAS